MDCLSFNDDEYGDEVDEGNDDDDDGRLKLFHSCIIPFRPSDPLFSARKQLK